MEDIKAKVTQDIVDSIINDMEQETSDINKRFTSLMQKEIEDYAARKEEIIESKLLSLREKLNKSKFKIESEMRFDIDVKLRNQRNTMLKEMENQLKGDIVAFVASPEYKHYLNNILTTLEHHTDLSKALIKMRKEDYSLIDKGKYDVEFVDLDLGGLILEIGNQVHDYSLERRFEDAMKDFISNSKVNI